MAAKLRYKPAWADKSSPEYEFETLGFDKVEQPRFLYAGSSARDPAENKNIHIYFKSKQLSLIQHFN